MDKYLTIEGSEVVFIYGKKGWISNLEKIKELGIVRKKKILPLEDISVLVVTALSLFLMLQTDIEEVYYVVPTVIFYAFIIILKYRDNDKFRYFVVLKENDGKTIKIRIEGYDRSMLSKEIGNCLKLKFDREVMNAK